MIKQILLFSWRNLKKNKLFSFINILGLSLGLTCTLIIFLWVQHQLSYDRFHTNLDNLYKVSYKDGGYTLPRALAKHLKENYPEIKNTTVFWRWDDRKITFNKNGFYSFGAFVDSTFFSMFSFPLIAGNKEKLFTNEESIVITEKLAKKIFGNENPIGKIVDYNQWKNLTVTGVLKDLPSNTQIQFEYLMPIKLVSEQWRYTWNSNNSNIYAQLHENVSPKELDKKIADIINQFNKDWNTTPLSLFPLADWNLYNLEGEAKITYVYIFSFIALLILLIACINFINLSTAQSLKRTKEIFIKKVVGSKRTQLFAQFLTESVLTTFVSMLLAILFTEMMLPFVSQLLSADLQLIYDLVHLGILVGLTILTALIAGIYPSLIMSSKKPIALLVKGGTGFSARRQQSIFSKIFSARNSLVIFQYSLSILLIITGIIIYKQLNYIQNKDWGYAKENVLIVKMGGALTNEFANIKQSLIGIPEVINVSYSANPNTSWGNSSCTNKWNNLEQNTAVCIGTNGVDYDYAKTLGIKINEGRFLSKQFSTDAQNAIVINEAAVKAFNFENPIGKVINNIFGDDYTVVGVMEDFHTESLRAQINPFGFIFDENGSHMYIKIASGNLVHTIENIKKKVSTIVPDDPFEFSFLDDQINSLYKTEKTTGILINYGTAIALFISCLGIFGLAIYNTQNRIKEIGVRKVNGAKISEILMMLNKDLVKWVAIAFVIASPIAYFAMTKWLENFAYKTELSWWIFALAGGIALFIALATVSWQSWRAATQNPVEALRHE